jgi:hypothetical protein
MHTLEEIYQQLLTTQAQVVDLEARLNADGKQVTSGDMVLIRRREGPLSSRRDRQTTSR